MYIEFDPYMAMSISPFDNLEINWPVPPAAWLRLGLLYL